MKAASARGLDELLAEFGPDEIADAIARLPPEHQEALAADEARENFGAFVRQAWPIVDPDPLVWNWHLDAFCIHLAAVARREITRFACNVPPGHAKSLIFSVLWPAWVWTWWPEHQFICASYAAELSVRDSVRCRQVIESEWYRTHFADPGGWMLRYDQNAKHYFVNTAGGHRFATSVGGGLGFRGHTILIDDPISAAGAYSKAVRDEAIRWMGQTMSTRFVDASTGAIVMIMQRLHEEDPTGWVLESKRWTHVRIPSEYEADNPCVTHVVLNGKRYELWRDPRKAEGELLFPAKFPKEVLQAAQAPDQLGADGYAGQHQQRPAPAAGGMFKKAAWRFWKPDAEAPSHAHQRPRGCWDGDARPLPELERVIISVDATFKKTDDGSYVAIHCWGKAGADRFLLDRVHARMDFHETLVALESFCNRHPEALEKFIEEKANGAAIISELNSKISGFIPVEPEGGKEARAAATQPYQAAGNVYLPDGAPWLDWYVSEHAGFPKGKYNDDVDCQAQAIRAFESEQTTADIWASMNPDG